MAEQLDKPPPPSPAKGVYRWEENGWTNGSWWTAHRGIDFTCEPHSFREAVYRFARNHGYHCETRITGGAVSFQLTQPSEGNT